MGSKVLSYKKIFEKKLCFQYLLHLDSSGIIALVNEKHKKIFVVASRHVMKTLGSLVSDLANKTHPNKELRKDRRFLQLRVLEQCEPGHLTANKLKYIDSYKSQGYSIYNTEVLPEYQIKTRIIDNMVEICLVTQGKRWYPVKRFVTESEAGEFVKQYSLYDLMKML